VVADAKALTELLGASGNGKCREQQTDYSSRSSFFLSAWPLPRSMGDESSRFPGCR
jgi:hypothetical protein